MQHDNERRVAGLANNPSTSKNEVINVRQRGAAGKALIVYLFSGSLLAAGAAYLLFTGVGC